MGQPVFEGSQRLNLTATDNSTIVGGPGKSRKNLVGIFVASASGSPSIKVADAAGTIVNTFTPVAATWYPMPVEIQGQLVVTIANTVDCTVFYVIQ